MNTQQGSPPVAPTLLRMLVDAVIDESVYMLDPLGRILSWNAGAERTMGYVPEDVLGRSVAMFYRAEDVACGVPYDELAIAARRGFLEHEGWRVGADGEAFRADVTLRAIRNAAQQLVGFARVARKATAHPADPASVGDSSEPGVAAVTRAGESDPYRTAPVLSPHAAFTLLNVILNAVTANYFAVDDDWRLTAVGDGVARLVTEPASALLGQRLHDVVAAGSRGEFLRSLQTQLGPERVSQHLTRDVSTNQSQWAVVTRGPIGCVVLWSEFTPNADTPSSTQKFSLGSRDL